jgi:hypothetical protein
MKRYLFAVSFAFTLVSLFGQAQGGAQETVYIRIGGQYYAAAMPEDGEELKALVRKIAEAEIKLDEEYLGYKGENERLQGEYLAKIDGQLKDIDRLSQDISALQSSVDELSKRKSQLEAAVEKFEKEALAALATKKLLAVGIEGGYTPTGGRVYGGVILPLNLFNGALITPKLGVEYDAKKPGIDVSVGISLGLWIM